MYYTNKIDNLTKIKNYNSISVILKIHWKRVSSWTQCLNWNYEELWKYICSRV